MYLRREIYEKIHKNFIATLRRLLQIVASTILFIIFTHMYIIDEIMQAIERNS